MATDSVLDKTLLSLHAEIATREAELQVMKAQFKTLEDARAILIAKSPPGLGALEQFQALASAGKERGLQDMVLDYLHASPDPDGATIKQVTEALRADFESKYNTRNSYGASIYMALKRLVEQNKAKVVETSQSAPKRWVATDSTLGIFDAGVSSKLRELT